MKKVLKDKINERIRQIFDLIEQGYDRETISIELGYKSHKNLDAYLRRNGYVWDKRFNRYVSKIDGCGFADDDLTKGATGKVREIIIALSRGGYDLKTLAQHFGFNDHKELAQYMLHKGYTWDFERGNYYPVEMGSVQVDNNQYINVEKNIEHTTMTTLEEKSERDVFIDFLFQNRERLEQLLNQSDEDSLPQYMVPGILVTKSVHMTNLLDQLVRDFSQEKNIKQRIIFEIALIDFFKKYGYLEEVRRLLK